MPNFIKNISPLELTILAIILLVLFGRKLFVLLARMSGETFKEMKGVKKSITDVLEDEEPKKSTKSD